nr:uncharacterized protein LOC126527880 isoform X2 [Dermacentor andersoni]
MPDITFCPYGIEKLIDSLKLTSSSGVDEINVKMLKNTKTNVSAMLCAIFQQSLSSGVVPEDWRVGKIVPVPKKDSRASDGGTKMEVICFIVDAVKIVADSANGVCSNMVAATIGGLKNAKGLYDLVHGELAPLSLPSLWWSPSGHHDPEDLGWPALSTCIF